MPFTKTFGTTAGSYSTATNWRPNTIRSPDFSWTLSGSGTNEYYVRTAANGNPGFQAKPANVYINGANATEGTRGTLAAGTWGWGDGDTLGYNTVYVRLTGGGDPDAQVVDHVQFYQIPQATEHVRFAANSASINSATGLDQSGVAIGDFIVEEGCEASFGSATLGYLIIDPDRFEFSGNGEAFLNLHSANIDPQIHKTGRASSGERGLYLRGSNLGVLNIMGGKVGVAVRPGETSTVATARVQGTDSSLWVGNGVTLTTLHQYAGEVRLRCGATTKIIYGGKHTTEENGAMTTVTLRGGEYIYKSTANITTFNLYGGTFDMQQSGDARTVSTLNKHRGTYRILRNKEAVTITTETPQDSYTESVTA